MTECMQTTTICLWEIRSGAEKRTWKITGLVALSDYSCLFQNNNDSMFDAVKFGVSVVTEEEFDSLEQENCSTIIPGSMTKNRRQKRKRKKFPRI